MNSFDANKAKQLAEKIIKAEADLANYLSRHFPRGSKCGVILMTGQKNQTQAEIVGVSPTRYGGEISVEISGSKARGSRRYRSVPARFVTLNEVKGGTE